MPGLVLGLGGAVDAESASQTHLGKGELVEKIEVRMGCLGHLPRCGRGCQLTSNFLLRRYRSGKFSEQCALAEVEGAAHPARDHARNLVRSPRRREVEYKGGSLNTSG